MEALDTGRLFLPPKGLRRLFAALTGQGRDGAGDGAGEILPVPLTGEYGRYNGGSRWRPDRERLAPEQ